MERTSFESSENLEAIPVRSSHDRPPPNAQIVWPRRVSRSAHRFKVDSSVSTSPCLVRSAGASSTERTPGQGDPRLKWIRALRPTVAPAVKRIGRSFVASVTHLRLRDGCKLSSSSSSSSSNEHCVPVAAAADQSGRLGRDTGRSRRIGRTQQGLPWKRAHRHVAFSGRRRNGRLRVAERVLADQESRTERVCSRLCRIGIWVMLAGFAVSAVCLGVSIPEKQ